MDGYACLSDAAAGMPVAGCTPLWETDSSTLTADQISDLATLEEDYFDAPSADSHSDALDTVTPAFKYDALHDIDKYALRTAFLQGRGATGAGSLADDSDTSPCTTDSDGDDDDTKVVDETKGAQLQGGVMLTPTLCAADCNGTSDFRGEAAPTSSRKHPAMGLGSEHQAKLSFALLHNCDPTKVEINTLHRIGIKTYRTLFKMFTTDSPYHCPGMRSGLGSTLYL